MNEKSKKFKELRFASEILMEKGSILVDLQESLTKKYTGYCHSCTSMTSVCTIPRCDIIDGLEKEEEDKC